jgi:hypothetical protein
MVRIVLLLLILTGCTSTQIAQSPAELFTTHGYAYIALPKTERLTIEVIEVATGKSYSLQPRASDYASLGYWLPAGDYRFKAMGEYKLTDYDAFSIEAGRLTNLGAFASFDIGEDNFVFLPFRHASLDAEVRAVMGENASWLSGSVIEWEMSVRPEPMKRVYESRGWA